MTSAILSTIVSIASAASDLMQWIKNKQLISLGTQAQIAADLESEKASDEKITAIRDKSFDAFDKLSSSNSLPVDIKLRD